MSAPYTSGTVEDRLVRILALLCVVESILEEEIDALRDVENDDLHTGAEMCLEQAIDLVDQLRVGLPANVLTATIAEAEKAGAR